MKNANIKSEEELEKRLMYGEEFYYKDGKVWYDFKKALDGNSPFRFGDSPLCLYWQDFADFEVKQNWYDTVSKENPVLCMCWGNGDTEKKPRIITGYYPKNDIGSIYTINNSCGYRYAEPITSDSPLIYKEE